MALNVPVATRTPVRQAATRPLADLDLGGQATIIEVSLEGPARERLLDLGHFTGLVFQDTPENVWGVLHEGKLKVSGSG